MELRKRITVLVPSELVYAFDPNHEHVFVAAHERGRIVARPMEEYISLRTCAHHCPGSARVAATTMTSTVPVIGTE